MWTDGSAACRNIIVSFQRLPSAMPSDAKRDDDVAQSAEIMQACASGSDEELLAAAIKIQAMQRGRRERLNLSKSSSF